MYESLHVELQNCYGIGSLKADFDFKQSRTTVLYAPNGAMKTSFARTFMDISKNEASVDRIFTDRETLRVVHADGGAELDSAVVVVIEPFNSSYESKSLSRLLVNEDLRKEYDSIHSAVAARLSDLSEALAKTSGIRKADVVGTFLSDTTISRTDVYTAFARMERQVSELSEPLFSLKYKDVLNDKILALISGDDIQGKIKAYSEKYEELLQKSRFFRAGKFNHYNASTVAKILKENGWFAGGHTVTLRNGDAFIEVSNEADLAKVIQEELDSILSDAELKVVFGELDKALNKNAELREYREFLHNNSSIIAELADIRAFKERLWLSYLCEHRDAFGSLVKEYDAARKELDRIRGVAKAEASRWQEVIGIFNERFSVPFRVYVDNQEDVILQSVTPSLGFSYFDPVTDSEKKISSETLENTLSQGERRAKYLLNVIFEMEGRKGDDGAIFIVDDIADSFDYKNKYAIIEYLKDISDHSNFVQIILTHNYDFFRTVVSRLELYEPNRLYASKSGGNIAIRPTPKEQNPFVNWKEDLSKPVNVIACIPFVRNIAEYCGQEGCFLALTSALHWKEETPSITFGDVSKHFGTIITDGSADVPNKDVKYIDALFQCCDELVDTDVDDYSLEKKIVLSIGIRLAAERFMVQKIADEAWVKAIKKNQTGRLTKKYSEKFSGDSNERDGLKIVRRVNLITPENIHVNSFMYEPILDISPLALRNLYLDVNSKLI